jgi:ribosome recycling factor
VTPESIIKDMTASMNKSTDYLKSELKGIRTGRASTALLEYIKVDYYGSMTDLKALAAISVHDAHQLVVQPFDPGATGEIRKAIENAELGLNPQVDGKVIRVNVPTLSGERRQQLVGQVKKLGEETKVAVRNARRDANKHADQLAKDKNSHLSEDQIADLKDQIQELLKKRESDIDTAVKAKSEDIQTV